MSWPVRYWSMLARAWLPVNDDLLPSSRAQHAARGRLCAWCGLPDADPVHHVAPGRRRSRWRCLWERVDRVYDYLVEPL